MNKMEMIRILNGCISRLDNMTITDTEEYSAEDNIKIDTSFIISDLMDVIWALEDEVKKEG